MASIGDTLGWDRDRALHVASDCKDLWLEFLDNGDLGTLFTGINELEGYSSYEKYAVALMMGQQIQMYKAR